MLFAGKPRVSMRGCSAAVSQCLTGGFVLSLSGCSHWREGGRGGVGWGWGFRGALTANSMNPPGALALSASLPPFPLASFLLPSVFLFPVAPSPSLSSWPCHLQSWTRGQLGLIPELARHSWPIRSCHRGHLTQWLRANRENKALKRQSCGLFGRLSAFCVGTCCVCLCEWRRETVISCGGPKKSIFIQPGYNWHYFTDQFTCCCLFS